ncbi:thiol:disulfide interchange protein DsbA, partial [Striga asiatica]
MMHLGLLREEGTERKERPPAEVDLSWGIARKEFFDKLLNGEWLSCEHVDTARFHIREHAIEFPLLFREDFAILNLHFVSYLRMLFRERSKTQSFDKNYLKPLDNYARGINNDHWLALEIDLSGTCIYAYDSSTSVMRKPQFDKELKLIR